MESSRDPIHRSHLGSPLSVQNACQCLMATAAWLVPPEKLSRRSCICSLSRASGLACPSGKDSRARITLSSRRSTSQAASADRLVALPAKCGTAGLPRDALPEAPFLVPPVWWKRGRAVAVPPYATVTPTGVSALGRHGGGRSARRRAPGEHSRRRRLSSTRADGEVAKGIDLPTRVGEPIKAADTGGPPSKRNVAAATFAAAAATSLEFQNQSPLGGKEEVRAPPSGAYNSKIEINSERSGRVTG